MRINWKVRLQSYPFWVAVFGFVGLIVADLRLLSAGAYQSYVEAFLLILVAGGIVSDPTTDGYGDSAQALSYENQERVMSNAI